MSWLDELNNAGEEGEEDDSDDDASWDEAKEKQEEEDDDDEAPVASNGGHRTPLHTLVKRGVASDLQVACEAGAATGRVSLPSHPERSVLFEIDEPDSSSATPLHAALLGAVQAAVAASERDSWAEPSALYRPETLHKDKPTAPRPAAVHAKVAAQDASLACVEVLLRCGADPARRFYHRSALHLAGAIAALPPLAGFASAAAGALLAAPRSSAAQLLEAIDGNGATPLHCAAAGAPCGDAPSALDRMLACEGAAAALQRADRSGATALHVALRAGAACEANAAALLAAGARVDAADNRGMSALHLAAATGAALLEPMLRAAPPGAVGARDTWGRSPLELALGCGREAAAALLRAAVPPAEAAAAAAFAAAEAPPPKPSLLLSHPVMLLHAAPAGAPGAGLSAAEARRLFGQPECAARLRAMVGPLGSLRTASFGALDWCAAPEAALADVLRVHEWEYVRGVSTMCAELAVQEAEGGHGAPPAIGKVDADTEVTQHSYRAALRGAGAVVEAVRSVCLGRTRNAFCAVRPPGHHAGPRGAVGGQSAGFCVLSTAAIGAAHALHVMRDTVKRVAIVDFDIHHGNGTEACVRNVRPTQVREEWPCGAGTISLQSSSFKPWLSEDDSDKVFFGSIHGFGAEINEEGEAEGCFYPGSGPSTTDTDAKAFPAVRNAPMPLRTSSERWRREMLERLLVPLSAFAPDLIIISAGFDAHAHDPLEAGGLHEHDFQWMTAELVAIAETSAAGRVVSVLEGGYQVTGGPLSSLALAVASHVRVLMDPSLVGTSWSAADGAARLDALLAAERSWAGERAQRREAASVAAAAAAAAATAAAGGSTGSEAPAVGGEAAAPEPPEQQDNGAPVKRSKRQRVEVDYAAMAAKEDAERAAGGAAGAV